MEIMNLKFKKKIGVKCKNENYVYRSGVEGVRMDEIFQGSNREKGFKEGIMEWGFRV